MKASARNCSEMLSHTFLLPAIGSPARPIVVSRRLRARSLLPSGLKLANDDKNDGRAGHGTWDGADLRRDDPHSVVWEPWGGSLVGEHRLDHRQWWRPNTALSVASNSSHLGDRSAADVEQTSLPSGSRELVGLAEGEGFEPPEPFPVQWFSRPPPSTTRPSLRVEIARKSQRLDVAAPSSTAHV